MRHKKDHHIQLHFSRIICIFDKILKRSKTDMTETSLCFIIKNNPISFNTQRLVYTYKNIMAWGVGFLDRGPKPVVPNRNP